MTKKNRMYRTLRRAQNAYKKAREVPSNKLLNGAFFAQLKVMDIARQFNKRYPKPLPKITYNYSSSPL